MVVPVERMHRLRPWIKWTVVLVWTGTALCVFIFTRIHVPQVATVKVHARELRFRTGAWDILSAADQEQLTVSGPARFGISTIPLGKPAEEHAAYNTVVQTTSAASSCTFYNVRTSPIKLQTETTVILLWPKNAREHTLVIRLQEPINGSISVATSSNQPAGYLCTGTMGETNTSSGRLSDSFESSFSTQGDAQLSYHQISSETLGENIKVTGEIRISHREPDRPGAETATLLPGGKNEIIFDELQHRTVSLNEHDLVRIEPGKDLYLRDLTSGEGITAEFHGTLNDIQVGSGSDAYRTCMPSFFDMLVARKEYITVIPGIAAGILGFLEAIGLLPRKK